MSLAQPFGKICRLGLAIVFCAGAFFSLSSDAVVAQKMTVGSKAPPIDIEHWVSDRDGDFEKVTDLKEGKVYIIEFWATWCGPCISSMPHLVEIQDKYADKGVQIISISDESLETVEGFLKKKVRGSKSEEAGTYAELTSAYCLTTDPDESVKKDYFRAAGRRGIPSAFIVGKTGLVEWIGHPMSMDKPLAQIVDDKWDREKYAADLKKREEKEKARNAEMAEFAKFAEELWEMKEDGDFESALKELDIYLKEQEKDSPFYKQGMVIRTALVMEAGGDEAIAEFKKLADGDDVQLINQFAWGVVEQAQGGDDVSPGLLKAACDAAKKAVELAKEDGNGEATAMILDTHANLLFLCDELDAAIKVQKEAVELSDDEEIAEFYDKLVEAKKKEDA